MEHIFKKGDRVFHIHYGWGIIKLVDSDVGEYSVGVSFDLDENCWFTHDGRELNEEKPTLSFTEYTFEGFSQERPEELPKKGDIVWVRDDKNEEWKIMHFIGLHPTSSYKYRVSKINSYSNTTDYIYMTTTNPYANEHN